MAVSCGNPLVNCGLGQGQDAKLIPLDVNETFKILQFRAKHGIAGESCETAQCNWAWSPEPYVQNSDAVCLGTVNLDMCCDLKFCIVLF